MFERSTSGQLPDILIEKQIWYGGHNEDGGRKRLEELRRSHDEFHQLETSERSGKSNQAVEDSRLKSALPGKFGDQQRADLICPVEVENLLPSEQDSRQEVVGEPGHLRAPVINRQAPLRQHPRILRGHFCEVAHSYGRVHHNLPRLLEAGVHGRRRKDEKSRSGDQRTPWRMGRTTCPISVYQACALLPVSRYRRSG